VWEEGSALRNE
jgi:hypothetical protein